MKTTAASDRGDGGQRDQQQHERPRAPPSPLPHHPLRALAEHRALGDHRRVGIRPRRELPEAGLELLDEVVHRLEPLGGVLRHRAPHRGVETERHVGALIEHGRRRLVDVPHRDRDEVLAVERHVPGQQLVEHAAERVDVGAGVDLLPARLLRRDVVRRCRARCRSASARADVERARDPEVGDLGLPLRRDEHVLRLHVAVHEPVRVREGERPRRSGARSRSPPARAAGRAARPAP